MGGARGGAGGARRARRVAVPRQPGAAVPGGRGDGRGLRRRRGAARGAGAGAGPGAGGVPRAPASARLAGLPAPRRRAPRARLALARGRRIRGPLAVARGRPAAVRAARLRSRAHDLGGARGRRGRPGALPHQGVPVSRPVYGRRRVAGGRAGRRPVSVHAGPRRREGARGGEGYKRPFDIGLLLAALLPFAPLWILLAFAVALAIRLEDGGPAIYAQPRLGRGGRTFRILKFRTMTEYDERRIGPHWAVWRRERTTAVGRVLRRFHLDELPQVVNVARGEMSLVGPRPERPELAEEIARAVPAFAERLAVRPGIAGLAQSRGGPSLHPRRKLRYDRLYIRRMSPWLDLKLLAACVWRTLRPVRGRAGGGRRSGPRPPASADPVRARPAPAGVPHNEWPRVELPSEAAFAPGLPVTVVVPCRDAPGKLALALAGLERQSYPEGLLEVVVVDDGSSPPLAVPRPPALPVRVVRRERRGFGLARARNAGAGAARHGILVFLDGDVIPEAGLVAAHARWHHAVSDAVTLGFCAFVSARGIDAAAVRDRPGSVTDLLAGRPRDAPWIERHMARTADLTTRHDDLFRALTGHNFGVSRAFFEEIGGFDESFARYGGEDTELGYRAWCRGGLLVPAREAFGWHQGRWAEGRETKERDQDLQAAKLAELVADPGFRPRAGTRGFAVPRHVVAVEARGAPARRVARTVEALLAGAERDLAVWIRAPASGEGPERLAERLGRDGRMRLGSPGESALDAFPASPFHLALPAGAVPGRGLVRALRSALGDAAVGEAVLGDGSRVAIARAWALHRARRGGGSAADYGDVRRIRAWRLALGRATAPIRRTARPSRRPGPRDRPAEGVADGRRGRGRREGETVQARQT
ncbi:MAG: glycosyltransferase, partial [Gemmatimonadales bacterium]|nr:glycosyltransferase [Gemmatimonadales bacterium]